MAAAAEQFAPKKNKPAQPVRREKAEKPGAAQRLYDLPRAAGVAALIVLLAASLFVGNFRALQSAAPKAFYRQSGVQSILEDRVTQADNVVLVANRAGLSDALILEAEKAMAGLQGARSARDISRADQLLTAAVAELTTADIADEETARSMRSAADNFAEQGSFLRQAARTYNIQANKALTLYESLPLKALFSEPDVYEGI